jgi:hypothetical protein
MTVMGLTLKTLIWEMDFRVGEGPTGRGERGPSVSDMGANERMNFSCMEILQWLSGLVVQVRGRKAKIH